MNTRFQEEYLAKILQTPIESLDFIGKKPDLEGTIDNIIFAVTSSNMQNSRYNPVPFHVRAVSVDRFARKFKEALDVNYRILGIPHYRPSDRFADITLKEIANQTEGELKLTPENAVVLCSTPGVIKLYQTLGFGVLPAELESLEPKKYLANIPMEIIPRIAELGEGWKIDGQVRDELSLATFSTWSDFPEVPRRLTRLFTDPMLTEQGSLTENRDYANYAYGMGNKEIIEIKYNDIKDVIKAGKIVDEGCADGALLVPISKDFPDSDLIGVDITSEFIARAEERQRANAYGEGGYVFFYQRNITDKLFEPNSIDTTICNSTLHELWSYGNQEKTIREYLANKFDQTWNDGGRLVIRDVVGPEDKDQIVYMKLNGDDSVDRDIYKKFDDAEQLKKHLDGLSTLALFKRFAADYLTDMRLKGKRGAETKIQYQEVTKDGQRYIKLKLKDAVEFMTKKDYTDNWESELNEEFAFWSFNEWKGALKEAGFKVIETPNEPSKGSRQYTSDWIVENSWKGKVELYNEKLELMQNPVTNMVLVGEKPQN